MKQIVIKKGQIIVDQTAAPELEGRTVKVQVLHSFISTGTEMSGIESSSRSIVNKVLNQPEKIKKAYDMVVENGIKSTIDFIRAKETEGSSSGYSLAGRVLSVGDKIKKFKKGDLVACAGAGFAIHAETVVVPENLVVRIPQGCSTIEASSVAIGAIALQAVRRASVQIGETIAVLGLGLIGQITAQILNSAGCRVIGTDIDDKTIKTAKDSGLVIGLNGSKMDIVPEIDFITGRLGVDATIICASSTGSELIQQAMQITRKKGKVVIVGAVGMNLKRKPFYEKEIDLLISCSYGPGRYDSSYEIDSIDYPRAYVRWTENENMSAYLDLVARKKITLDNIVRAPFPLEKAADAYAALKNADDRPLGAVLSYNTESESDIKMLKSPLYRRTMDSSDRIKVAVVGAGGFATSVHLPNLKLLAPLYQIKALVGRNGNNLNNLSQRFSPAYVTTRYQDVLADPDIELIVICTRHNLHSSMAVKALKAGKAVFLEKPLSLKQQELDQLVSVYRDSDVPLMVGFNRRFSPASILAKSLLSPNRGPMEVVYRVKANPVPPAHWVQTEEGGGRVLGEACHMLDWFQFITGSKIREISVGTISPKGRQLFLTDNFTASVQYDDGSLCTLVYTTQGSKQTSKERIELFSGDKTLLIDDFKCLTSPGEGKPLWRGRSADKGHLQELEATARALKENRPMPISFEDLVETTRATLMINTMLYQ